MIIASSTARRFFPILFLVLSIVSEILSVFYHPISGIAGYAVLVPILISVAAFVNEEKMRRFSIAMLLVPLIRIISLTLPLTSLTPIWQLSLIYFPLLLAALIVIRLTKFDVMPLLFHPAFSKTTILIPLSGVVIGFCEYLILNPSPYVRSPEIREMFLLLVVFIVTTGFVEELIFRGILQSMAKKLFGKWGIPYISLVFGIMHLGFMNVLDVVFVMLVALFFGYVVEKTDSLWGVILAHGIANFLLFEVLPVYL